jgi:hypothetical protein
MNRPLVRLPAPDEQQPPWSCLGVNPLARPGTWLSGGTSMIIEFIPIKRELTFSGQNDDNS